MVLNTMQAVGKLETGIPGFDLVAEGGVPEGRTTLVVGGAGAGKTIFGLQYLIEGIRQFDQNGVFVTFEESPENIIRNAASLGWDLQGYIEQGRAVIVDLSPSAGEEVVEAGVFDLTPIVVRVENAIRKSNAQRVVLDSLGAIFGQFGDAHLIRRELFRVADSMRMQKVTSILTAEQAGGDDSLARYGIEEFVADNVVILRNEMNQEKRRRTLEVLKFRGASHQRGGYPFTINGEDGLVVIPLSSIELTQRSSNTRISSGNLKLDEMCNGGVFRDSIILVSGCTGTGKTLMVCEFLKVAKESGERCMLFAFEESREQLIRNAASWGVDFEKAEQEGTLRIVCRYPEVMSLEDHLILIKREVEAFKPTRVAIDSMSALERVSGGRAFREFIIGVTSYLKSREVATIITNTTDELMGGRSVTETHISTITDSIILLRYVELQGVMRRGIMVLKMRGSWHDKSIREYEVSSRGMEIKEPFRGVSGILNGQFSYTFEGEKNNLEGMFSTDGESVVNVQVDRIG